MNTVECPECGKVLKTANPIAPGKKVRCPGCKEIFTMPATKSKPPSSNAVRAKTATPSKPPIRDDDDDDDLPRPKRKRREEEDEDIDDEDEDDRPRKKKKRKKQAGPNWAMIGGGVGGGVLVLVLILGFVWPGFFKGAAGAVAGPGGAAGAGQDNLLAYMPKGAQLFAGADVSKKADLAKMLQEGVGSKMQQQLQQIPGAAGNMPKDVLTGLDVSLRDAQQLIVGIDAKQGAEGSMACAVSTGKAVDIKEIAKAFQADKNPAKDHQGKPYYQLPNGPPGGPPVFIGQPNGRVLLLGVMPEEEYKSLLASDGKQVQIFAEAQALISPLSKSYLWSTVILSGELGNGLRTINAQTLPAELKSAAAALQNVKAVSAWGDEGPSKEQKLSISVSCASDADAAALSGAANAFYQKQGRPMLAMVGLMAAQPGNEALGDLVNELTKTLKIESQGALAQVSLSISEQTYKKLENMQGQMLQQFGMGGKPAPKVIPKKK